MSVVMMQRKLKAKQNMSRGTDGFSIKGTRRNLGRIGSDSKKLDDQDYFLEVLHL